MLYQSGHATGNPVSHRELNSANRIQEGNPLPSKESYPTFGISGQLHVRICLCYFIRPLFNATAEGSLWPENSEFQYWRRNSESRSSSASR